jgi:CDK-activating kinase assembly factor MAT1
MCRNCVERLFTSGPAPCPVPHCARTLRKKGFHSAFFGDLKIEKEVDVRKRVGKVFNRRAEEFEGLREWNDYLEEVEGLVFDICAGGKGKLVAEDKLKRYKEGHEGEIQSNAQAALDAAAAARDASQKALAAARQRRLAAKQEEEDVKHDVETSRMEILNRLANEDGDAEAITRQAKKVMLKKSSARRKLGEQAAESMAREEASALSIRGLKKKVVVSEEAYDPFGGMEVRPSMYALQTTYANSFLDGLKKDGSAVGGWDVGDYYKRTMFEAFSGLGVFVEEEVAGREEEEKSIGTAGAAVAVAETRVKKIKIKMESDDVF